MSNEVKTLNLQVENYNISINFQSKNGINMVAIRPLCEALGLNYASQYRKLMSNPQFSCCHMTTTELRITHQLSVLTSIV